MITGSLKDLGKGLAFLLCLFFFLPLAIGPMLWVLDMEADWIWYLLPLLVVIGLALVGWLNQRKPDQKAIRHGISLLTGVLLACFMMPVMLLALLYFMYLLHGD